MQISVHPGTIQPMSATDSRARALLDAARELAPAIREAAPAIEQTRELPKPLFKAMADAGLFHMMVPHELGGAELSLPAYIEIVEEIGKADASTAWCLNQGGIWATHACCMPPDLAREVFFGTPRSVVANTPSPNATAVPVEGGYLVTGRQGFSTGSRHASWIASRGRILDDGKPRRLPSGEEDARFFMFPVNEVTLLDTWHTRGLRGTGTHDFEVKDAFVPEHRTFLHTAQPRPEYGPLYAIPRSLMFATGDATIAVSLARSTLDAFIELANGKTPGWSSELLRDHPLVQYELGQAEAHLRAARSLLFETVREIWGPVSETGTMTMPQRVALRTATTFALRSGAKVVDTAYNLAGATAVYESHPLQRYFQDAHVVTQHVQSRLNHFELVGKYYLGLDTNDARYL
jgi:alkylation response protein AidB-like acyl-CoA dehydrogenase